MEKHVRLIVLEHLGNQLDVHVLDVDFLENVKHHWQAENCIQSSYLKALVQ
jgi:hypothetical protein